MTTDSAPSAELIIVKGPDAGRRFRLSVGSFRVVGRAYGLGGTAMMSQGERRRLDAEDQRRVTEHLMQRANMTRPGARATVDNFERDDDIDLSDDAVSQTHAMVFFDEAGASMVDVASTNGCAVNGKRITEADLVDGDLVRVGETRFEVHLSSAG